MCSNHQAETYHYNTGIIDMANGKPKRVVKIAPHLAEFAVATAKQAKIPLNKLLAEALTAWCRDRGKPGITHHESSPDITSADLRW